MRDSPGTDGLGSWDSDHVSQQTGNRAESILCFEQCSGSRATGYKALETNVQGCWTGVGKWCWPCPVYAYRSSFSGEGQRGALRYLLEFSERPNCQIPETDVDGWNNMALMNEVMEMMKPGDDACK